jgi:hypothetical protein
MTVSLEPLLRDAEKRAVLTVLRANPNWTLGDLLRHMSAAAARAEVLERLTLGELMVDPRLSVFDLPEDDGPLIDKPRLRRAHGSHGSAFDSIVLEVIAEAPRPVGAAYLRDRVGGPRWKLHAALQRLLGAGLIRRDGTTSATRYRKVTP